MEFIPLNTYVKVVKSKGKFKRQHLGEEKPSKKKNNEVTGEPEEGTVKFKNFKLREKNQGKNNSPVRTLKISKQSSIHKKNNKDSPVKKIKNKQKKIKSVAFKNVGPENEDIEEVEKTDENEEEDEENVEEEEEDIESKRTKAILEKYKELDEKKKNRLFVKMKKKITNEAQVKELHPDIREVIFPRKKNSRWCWAVFASQEKAHKALVKLIKNRDIIVTKPKPHEKVVMKREGKLKTIKRKKEIRKKVQKMWM